MRPTSWDEVPLVLTISDLRTMFGFSREQAYRLAHTRGRRVGGKFLIPKAAVREWLEGGK